MSASVFHEWVFRSFAVAGIAALCVALCPAGWRVRVRRVVPVVAFAVLLALGAGFFRPLPAVELAAPAALAGFMTSTAGTLGPWIIRILAMGVVLFLVRLAAGAFTVHSLTRRSRPVKGGGWHRLLDECRASLCLRGEVALRFAGPGFIPSATGLFRRTVLLPDEAREWTREQRRLVLLHELGHFRRGDLWTHALGRLACALHWFNPFVWVLHRHLAIEREFACDALVLSRGAAPADYATLLWKMGVAANGRRPGSAGFLTMAAEGRGTLEQRVRRILSPVAREGMWLRVADSALCAMAAAALLAGAAFKPVIVRVFLGTGAWTPQEVAARFAADPFPEEK